MTLEGVPIPARLFRQPTTYGVHVRERDPFQGGSTVVQQINEQTAHVPPRALVNLHVRDVRPPSDLNPRIRSDLAYQVWAVSAEVLAEWEAALLPKEPANA